MTAKSRGDIWFVYDGDCPICCMAAHALRIREAVGKLHIVNARAKKTHPVYQRIVAAGYDLDAGMVIQYQDSFYHGEDALHLMAMLGTGQGWFNRMNAVCFRTKGMARFWYPAMRAARNFLLWCKGVPQLHAQWHADQPTFRPVFGKAWERLPAVMHKHYANRPYSTDSVRVDGQLDVMCKWFLKPVFRLLQSVPPYEGEAVPVTVRFTSEPDSLAFAFDREFRFAGRKAYHFRSRMLPMGGNEIREVMRYGIGWHCYYGWDGEKVTLRHKGYSLQLFGRVVPLPITWLIGRGDAEEWPVSENTFDMAVQMRHPLLGVVYAYKGRFTVVEGA